MDNLGRDEALEVVDDIGPFEVMALGDGCCWAADMLLDDEDRERWY